MLWACEHAKVQNNDCTHVLCNICKLEAESKEGKGRHNRRVLTTGAACVHDVWSLDMKEDNSYYTKSWHEKHRANQISKGNSLFYLPLKCSGCEGEIEDQ